jgi:hypothetical protein
LGLHDLYEFDLFSHEGAMDAEQSLAIQHRLLEQQPAKTGSLEGGAPSTCY